MLETIICFKPSNSQVPVIPQCHIPWSQEMWAIWEGHLNEWNLAANYGETFVYWGIVLSPLNNVITVMCQPLCCRLTTRSTKTGAMCTSFYGPACVTTWSHSFISSNSYLKSIWWTLYLRTLAFYRWVPMLACGAINHCIKFYCGLRTSVGWFIAAESQSV